MSARTGRGLVVGKFLPPHLGHSACIDAAVVATADPHVVVCDSPGQRPDAATRARWIAEMHPEVTVTVMADLCSHHCCEPCVPECSTTWAAAVRTALGDIDVVFSSESYGPLFADALGAAHVAVDPPRRVVPTSGTAVRGSLSDEWRHLHPVVRVGLVRRVVVLGAESTGTTTLSKALAERLDAPWVREAGRDVSAELAAEAGGIAEVRWNAAAFAEIAECQLHLEAHATACAAASVMVGPHGPLVVCDTDVAATSVWARRYLGELDLGLEAHAKAQGALLYVLTSHEGVPFVDDGLRDGEAVRAEMTGWFRELLERIGAPHVEVHGTPEERLDAALDAIADAAARDQLFATG